MHVLLTEIESIAFCKREDANVLREYSEEWLLECPILVHDAIGDGSCILNQQLYRIFRIFYPQLRNLENYF